MKKIISIYIIFFIVIIPFSYAHSGRTDSNGGHYDWSTGEYHYHNDGSSYENELIIEDSDNSTSTTSSWYEYKINRLNNNLESKQKKINELTVEVDNLNKKIDFNKFCHFIYITAITIFILCLYGIKKEFKKYKTLSKIIMKELGTSDIDRAIADTIKFYENQGINIEGDDK